MAVDLSERAKVMLNKRDFLDHYTMMCLHDPYHKENNKMGYVNLGTSVSALCEDLILKRLNQSDLFQFGLKAQHYYPMWGIPELREAIANCLTRHLAADRPVLPENVLVVNGGVAAMEVLACCLLDPGDVLLTPSPCYTRIFVNFSERFNVHVEDVLLRDESKMSSGEAPTFELNAEILETTIMEQKAAGRKVKAFFLVNPSNPLGEVYSPELVLQLMEVCQRYGLHFISDEAYAMSVYEPQKIFHSILSLRPLPNQQKTHVIWSFSKDLTLAGMRIGAIITWNRELLNVVRNTSMYTAVPAIVQQAAARLLNDSVWLDIIFLPTHRQRLQDAAHRVRDALTALKVKVRPAHAGFFLWADFRSFLPVVNHEEELVLFKKFMEHKVYLTPGSEMKCVDPGWFRVVFTAPSNVLDEGILRIAETLKELTKEQNTQK
ncbi:probable inactive 1-aminocyclopropane-1-carboxylate synthase-like protein 2 [Periplaneta americana]|uniref:probable inactive 1-aminocyclopropane-1-carboxylate synthase-like protein 2 n=1 Tax=Periplaneta americana TaxID=6978 RepID=UPI0037E95940